MFGENILNCCSVLSFNSILFQISDFNNEGKKCHVCVYVCVSYMKNIKSLPREILIHVTWGGCIISLKEITKEIVENV